MRGLEEKGFLSHETFGNTYRYQADVTADEYKSGALKRVVAKYFNNSYLGVVSSLVKEEEISTDELRSILDAHQCKKSPANVSVWISPAGENVSPGVSRIPSLC